LDALVCCSSATTGPPEASIGNEIVDSGS
jgi:hypothetical protein